MSKPTSPTLQSSNSLSAGLIRCFAFVEGSGSTVADYSASAAPLTTRTSFATAPATWGSDSTQGGYITFDGSTRDAIGADTGLPTGNAARTFAFLFRTSSKTDDFFFGYGTTGDSALGIGLTQGPNASTVRTLWTTTLTHGAGGSIDQSDGAWHLGHVILDGADNLFAYVDGAAVAWSDGGFGSPTTEHFTPVTTALSGHLYLGQIGTTAGTNPDNSLGQGGSGNNNLTFAGDIAGAWAWSRALSVSDVANHNSDPWQMVRPAAVTPTPSPTTPTPTVTPIPTPTTPTPTTVTPQPTPTTPTPTVTPIPTVSPTATSAVQLALCPGFAAVSYQLFDPNFVPLGGVVAIAANPLAGSYFGIANVGTAIPASPNPRWIVWTDASGAKFLDRVDPVVSLNSDPIQDLIASRVGYFSVTAYPGYTTYFSQGGTPRYRYLTAMGRTSVQIYRQGAWINPPLDAP